MTIKESIYQEDIACRSKLKIKPPKQEQKKDKPK